MLPLAVISFAVFVVAGLFKLTSQHESTIQWLLIIGGLVISAAVIWGSGRPWWSGRSGTRGA